MIARNREEFHNSFRALKEFEEHNPFTVDQNRVTRFIAYVIWKRTKFQEFIEPKVTVHWNFDDINGPNIVIDTQRKSDNSEHFHADFSPNFQFYIYDQKNNVLRIKDDQGLYEVVIKALRGRDD